MQTRQIHLISKDKTHRFFHPHDSLLQAHEDGELDQSQDDAITGHIEHCLACQTRLTSLTTTLQQFHQWLESNNPVDPSSLVRGLAKLQVALHEQETLQPWVGELSGTTLPEWDKTREQIFEEIGTYLGRKMMDRLSKDLGHGLEDNQKLILAAEPMLAAFLGKRAAARVHEFAAQIASRSPLTPGEFNPNQILV
ncbi:MAG: hypothetical protein U0V70_19040 [Terriglobia bacterium]